GCACALAGTAAYAAGCARVRKMQTPFARRHVLQSVRGDRQPIQSAARENPMNAVVEAIAEDLDRQIALLRKRDELRKGRVDLALVQMRVELLAIHVQQRDLPCHAVARADASGTPFVFQRLPAITAEALEQSIGGVFDGNRSVEIAKYGPVGH